MNFELEEILHREEIYWRQNSQELWLQEGDHDTKYFHASAKMRRENNLIILIKDPSGNDIFEREGIQRGVMFFPALFYDASIRDDDLTNKSSQVLQHIL